MPPAIMVGVGGPCLSASAGYLEMKLTGTTVRQMVR
jgi:hypothetical protein